MRLHHTIETHTTSVLTSTQRVFCLRIEWKYLMSTPWSFSFHVSESSHADACKEMGSFIQNVRAHKSYMIRFKEKGCKSYSIIEYREEPNTIFLRLAYVDEDVCLWSDPIGTVLEVKVSQIDTFLEILEEFCLYMNAETSNGVMEENLIL